MEPLWAATGRWWCVSVPTGGRTSVVYMQPPPPYSHKAPNRDPQYTISGVATWDEAANVATFFSLVWLFLILDNNNIQN